MSVCRCAVCLSAGRSGFWSVVDGGGDVCLSVGALYVCLQVGLDFGASLMEEVMKALNMSGAVSLPSNADVTVTSTDHADADDDIDSDDDTVSGGSDSDTASSTSTQTDDQQLDPDTDVDTYQQSTICDVICPPQSTAVIVI